MLDTEERRVLADALKKYHDTLFTPGMYKHSIFGKAALILELESKVSDVVFCSECMHGGPPDENNIVVCGKHQTYMFENDFCSVGELEEFCEDN